MAPLLRLAEQALLYLPLVCGGYLSFSLLRIPNFSSEGAFVFGAYCAALVARLLAGLPPVLVLLGALAGALFGGACIGLCMGLLATRGNVPYLLASIITLGLCHGLHVFVLGGSLLPLQGENPLALLPLHAHPELLTLALVGLASVFVMLPLLASQLGHCFAAYGVNARFFAHHGISSNYIVIVGILCSNALAGLSGYLVAQASGFIDMNAGNGLSLLCVTALMLGNLCKKIGGSGVIVPLVGIGLYCALQQALLLIGMNLKYFTALQALVVLGTLFYGRRAGQASDVHSDHLGV